MSRASDAPLQPSGGLRLALMLAGLVCLGAMLALLTLGADSSATTPTTRRLFGLWRVRHAVPAMALALVGVGLILAAGPRQRLLAYLSMTLATLAMIGALEMLGRLGVVPWSQLLAPRSDELGSLGTKAIPHLDAKGVTYQDTASIWGLPSDPIPFHYRTDRYGFRNPVDRPSEEVDVILLGDSILVAALVPVEDTLGAKLEAHSGKRVMQVALIGISPQEEHDILWDAGLDLAGKRVVQFIFEGNDLLDSHSYRTAAEKTALSQSRDSLLGHVWDTLTKVTDRQLGLRGLRVCTVGEATYTFLWASNSFAGVEDEARRITDSLEAFADRVRAAGGTYAVVFVPKKLHVLKDLCAFPEEGEIRDAQSHIGPLRAHMTDWAGRSGIAFLDLTEPLTRAALSGEIPWFWGDTHLNAAGLAVAAQALTPWLEQTAGSGEPDAVSDRR